MNSDLKMRRAGRGFIHVRQDRNRITGRDYTHLTKRCCGEKVREDVSFIIDSDWQRFIQKNEFGHVGGNHALRL